MTICKVTTIDNPDIKVVTVDSQNVRVIRAGTAELSAIQIKTLYESNANTNAFTDAYKQKLDDLSNGGSGGNVDYSYAIGGALPMVLAGESITQDLSPLYALIAQNTAEINAIKTKTDLITVTQNIDLDQVITDTSYLPTPNLLEYSSLDYFYYGWEDVNGGWLIRRQNRTTLSELSATQTNNPSYTILTTAWANKESLIYG